MFQNLRAGSSIYILHKNGIPEIKTGSIINVTNPAAKYQMSPVFGQPQEMVVDLIVKVDEQEITYQRIPANLDIADFGNNGIVISDSKEAMNSEIMNLKKKSEDIINSLDYHKKVVENCNELLNSLNPELAERQHQQDEIKSLKEQIALMADNISTLIAEFKCENKK